jgi:hypothetical protein
MARRRRFLEAKTGIEIPGGAIVLDPYRGKAPIITDLTFVGDLLLSSFGMMRMKRDIVIQDDSRERELYRQGPYSETTANTAIKRMMAEIDQVGLDMFLMRRKVDSSQVDPIALTQQPLERATLDVRYLESSWERLIRIVTRRNSSG